MEIEESSYFLFYTLQMLENFASDNLDNSIPFCKKKKKMNKRDSSLIVSTIPLGNSCKEDKQTKSEPVPGL